MEGWPNYKSLKIRGFAINPYDWCIANKMIDGGQCTIVWHVDDLKISHIKSSVVDDIIVSLQEEYGKVSEMTVSRGKKHDYLGMTLDFSKDGCFIIDMEKYLDTILSGCPVNMGGLASTPAADHLFKTRENAGKLSEKDADLFHRITAQLLFVSQRGRPDLRTAVSFLDQNHWFVDGAFAVHSDMKGHTGGFMTFGRGMVDGSSRGQKINTTSSTECEVVAVHENIPAMLWTRHFLAEQGYPLNPTIVHQDNLSAKLR